MKKKVLRQSAKWRTGIDQWGLNCWDSQPRVWRTGIIPVEIVMKNKCWQRQRDEGVWTWRENSSEDECESGSENKTKRGADDVSFERDRRALSRVQRTKIQERQGWRRPLRNGISVNSRNMLWVEKFKKNSSVVTSFVAELRRSCGESLPRTWPWRHVGLAMERFCHFLSGVQSPLPEKWPG